MDEAGADQSRMLSRLVIGAAAALALVAGALWVRYGPTVFAEMMVSAWTACF